MSDKQMKILRIVLPLVIVAFAVMAAVAMVALKPDVETRPPEVKPPLVRVAEVSLQERQLTVTSQGTVSPRTESALVPEVSGRVIWVSPSFVSGGFFEKGELLLKIDSHDYEQAVIRSRAEVANAKLRMAQEEAEFKVAHNEWDDLGKGEATPLTLTGASARERQGGGSCRGSQRRHRGKKSGQDSKFERLTWVGSGRKNVDVGQFVTIGSPVGRHLCHRLCRDSLAASRQRLGLLGFASRVSRRESEPEGAEGYPEGELRRGSPRMGRPYRSHRR